VVGDGGVYACPILAGLPGARLTEATLKESFADAPPLPSSLRDVRADGHDSQERIADLPSTERSRGKS
jgi:hypothetical protein